MVTEVQRKQGKYNYLVLAFPMEEGEAELWEALFEKDKAELSAAVYRLIEREMPSLTESAQRRTPRGAQKQYWRKLYLQPLPEYAHVIRFVHNNLRRPAFRSHLKQLILYGTKKPEAPRLSPAPAAPPESATALEQAGKTPPQPGSCKRSPRELFAEPGLLIQAMIIDLSKPESEREFVWDEIPLEDYPEGAKKAASFSRLVRFWDGLNKTV